MVSESKHKKKKKSSSKQTSTIKAGSEETPDREAAGCPIVGIGASAGGLEALTELLHHLPADTGMAFVFIQHFAPGKVSMLPDILRRETPIPIVEAENGIGVEPDHLYVLSHYAHLSVEGRRLSVKPSDTAADRYLPVDHFFRALAEHKGPRAVGVVLSGTASDGTLGLKAIKASGGITIVQEPDSAKYDGMPHSAIAAGCADLILSPKDIAEELARIARHPYLLAPHIEEPAIKKGESLEELLALLGKRFGLDFTQYKHSTIERRIKRRMVMRRSDSLEHYLAYVKKQEAEQEALYRDLLINVTGFFRDGAGFEVLKNEVFPALIANRSPDDPIRIWVPACSSGEEAYSIAMALLEFLDNQKHPFPIQIFGTDVDDKAIAQARAGRYPENSAQDVTAGRLKRFFVRLESGYQVNKTVRELCVFSQHNVIRDPPFSRLDLISCRNLLIYMNASLQKKVLPIFHFALKSTGFLMLGSAETVGVATELFGLVDRQARIYRKKPVEAPLRFEFPVPGTTPPTPLQELPRPRTARGATDLKQTVNHLLLHEFAPPAVVIDEEMQIVEIRGHTGPYLEPAAGEASLNLLRMAREPLVAELRAAVLKAVQEDVPVHREHLRTDLNGQMRAINLDIRPLTGIGGGRYFVVVFEEVSRGETPARAEGPAEEESEEVTGLRQELAATKEYLHSVIEQQEETNEELRCANEEVQSSYEELQSTNEELQSTNEELQTAKEELQSTNEELRTVNDELDSRNAELSRVNDDLSNLITSVDLAVIMVGPDLHIRRFTPAAARLFNLIDTDAGRPVTDVRPTLHVPPLDEILARVIDQIKPEEHEVRDESGKWYLMRVHPRRTQDNRIEGAVIAIFDITELKRGVRAVEHARDYAQAVIAALRHPILGLDKDLRVVSVNQAYLETFGATEEDTVDNLVYRIGNGQWATPELRALLRAAATEHKPFDNFVLEHDFEHIGQHRVVVSGRTIEPGLERAPMVLMQIELADTEAKAG